MGVFSPHIIDLTIGGPPPGMRSTEGNAVNQRNFVKDRLADMRVIESDARNRTCILLGLFDPFDGFLDGWYIWEKEENQLDDGEIWVRPNDFGSRSPTGMWRKFK